MQQKSKPSSYILQNKEGFRAKFRYDINALRAIAVIGVVFFHYKIKGFGGGFSGVDVFFVISGYLMSKIIINSINDKSFGFINFYQKRLKRIVPALLFLTGVLSIICFFIYLPEDYKINQKNASASIVFLSNILYWKNSSYFDPASDTNIFLHTWSLSVEWQFYLLYPIIILALGKVIKNKKLFVFAFSAITLALFAISIISFNWKPIPAFYLLPTRAWEMLAGGLSFFAQGKIKHESWRKIVSLIGYSIIVLSFVLLDNTMPWPSLYTIIPIIATSLVIICNYDELKLVRNSTVQFIGTISYSLYLWHWPIYVISQYLGVEVNVFYQPLLCLLSIAIAYVSYKYVENANLSSRPILIFSSVIFTITILSSYFSVNRLIFKAKTLEVADYVTNHKDEVGRQMSVGSCFIVHDMPKTIPYAKKECLCISKSKKNILLIGDSHAAHLSESLRDSLGARNINLLQATASGGLPVLEDNGLDRFREIMGYIYHDFIPNNPGSISAVMISADWSNKKMANMQLVNDLKDTVGYLRKYGIKVFVIGQSETYIIPYTSIAAKDIEYGTNSEDRYLNKDSYEMDALLKSELKGHYIDIINTNHFPSLSTSNVPYMMDQNHFSVYGASLATHKILSNPSVKALVN